VQHTCAIECAQFVVSVNPDRSARIFDYGIVSRFA
jgi:electron transfer flavoprotein alpha subunit